MIPDPGPLGAFLPADEPWAAFLRGGEGFVAIGEAARFETDSADAADVWWSELGPSVEHETDVFDLFGAGPLSVGSFVFNPDHSSERSVMVLPRLILGRRDGRAWMTLVGRDLDDFGLPPRQDAPSAPSGVEFREGGCSAERWRSMVAEVVALIRAGEADKVVLARDLIGSAARPIDPRHLLASLERAYPSCYSFCVDGLVGASPELLVRLRGGLATSRVLAGTVRHTGDPDDAMRLASRLCGSGKDAQEHSFAVASVVERLAAHCDGMSAPEAPYVLDLPNVMHLASEVNGVVSDEATTSLALAAALHPSAAVGGTPAHVALDLIDEIEGIDRGRYAGPVGWIDLSGEGEWAIALRCGQIDPTDPSAIHLFAGCGIVAGSDPDEELAESNAKFVPMRDALTGGSGASEQICPESARPGA